MANQARTDEQLVLVNIKALQTTLQGEAENREQVQAVLEQAQRALADTKRRGESEEQKAREATARAERLEAEATELRQEVGQLRTLAANLAQLAAKQPTEPPPVQPQSPWLADLTENPLADFDMTTSDGALCLISRDKDRTNAGTASLRVDLPSQEDSWVTFPKHRSADWDFSKQTFLKLDLFIDDSNSSTLEDFRVRIGRKSSYIEYQPDEVSSLRGQWLCSMIPLRGNDKWTRRVVNHPDLSHVDWIEVHARSAKGPLTVWLDNSGLDKQPPFAVAPFDADQAKQHQQAWADYLNVPVEFENSIGMKMALIPPGEFVMGSPASDGAANDSEKPQHKVRITQPSYLGACEVTQGQYAAVMNARPWSGKGDVKEGSNYAASNVSFEDAVEYCARVSVKEGMRYRLPTEAEWEHACRGGTTTLFHCGDDASRLGEYTWFKSNTDDVSDKYAHEVGQKKPNSYGLHDMHGNVLERCGDWHGKDYYANSPKNDPAGPPSGWGRVHRGGSWNLEAWLCRSSRRFGNRPTLRMSALGFRVALVPESESDAMFPVPRPPGFAFPSTRLGIKPNTRWLGFAFDSPDVDPGYSVFDCTNIMIDRPWVREGDRSVLDAARDAGQKLVLTFYNDGTGIEEKVISTAKEYAEDIVAIQWVCPYYKERFPPEALAEFGQRIKKELPGIQFWVGFVEWNKDQTIFVPKEVDLLAIRFYLEWTPEGIRETADEWLPFWKSRATGRPMIFHWAPQLRWDGSAAETFPETIRECCKIVEDYELDGLLLSSYPWLIQGAGKKALDADTRRRISEEVERISRRWKITQPSYDDAAVREAAEHIFSLGGVIWYTDEEAGLFA